MMPTVLVTNPIPIALHHYGGEMEELLSDLGCTLKIVKGQGTERIEEPRRLRRFRNGMNYFVHCWKSARSDDVDEILVLWPLMGYLDVLLWEWLVPVGKRVRLIIHDVDPPGRLREQGRWGFLGAARWVGTSVRHLQRRVALVTHTEAGRTVLQSRGWQQVEYLPHPVRKVGEQDAISTVGKCDSDDPPTLTVAGQFKSTRTIDVLEKLGIIAASEGINLVLIGNGWPILAGWKQEKGFVSEGEFQRALAKSTAVLIPYAHYWQSGVAFRALEVGVPVLGLEHEQLATMYGTGYVGIVPELSVEAVVAALRRVSTTPRDEWLQTFRKFRDWVVSEWMTAFRDDSTEGLSV